jgi:MraZ protein
MLRGNALAKVDEKGRLKVPAVFRSLIESRYGSDVFVTSLRGDSVRIYPTPVFAELEDRLVKASAVEPLVSRLRSAVNYFGQPAQMDSQGRVLIHPLLRDRASIDGEVVWNRETFERRLIESPLTDAELRELASMGF